MLINVSVINTVRSGYDITAYDENDKVLKRLSKSGLSEHEANAYLDELKEKYSIYHIDRQSIVGG